MAPQEDMHTAMVNRSIRAIKAELEFLTDASVISPQTLSSILSQIPPQTALHAPISVGAVPAPTPAPAAQEPRHDTAQQPQAWPAPSPSPSPAPPYQTPGILCHATALYAYRGEDAGDLSLTAGEPIEVTEYMNAEWWKGRSTRSGAVGIFPRSYVRVEDKQAPPAPSGYGNMPLETSGMGNGTNAAPSQASQMGKKFGKKLGNAAIFGAGATLGSDLVNAIL